MKISNKIQIVVFLLFISFGLQAQTPVRPGTFTINGKTFLVTVSTRTFSDGGRMAPNTMHVVLVGGSINIPTVRPSSTQECVATVIERTRSKADFLRYFNILRTMFPVARCTAIFNNDSPLNGWIGISCTFNVNITGTLKDVSFTISENTLITQQEIELFYTTLMAQMYFTIPDNNCPTYAEFIFNDELRKMEDINVIHTKPYYFGNGPKWKGR